MYFYIACLHIIAKFFCDFGFRKRSAVAQLRRNFVKQISVDQVGAYVSCQWRAMLMHVIHAHIVITNAAGNQSVDFPLSS